MAQYPLKVHCFETFSQGAVEGEFGPSDFARHIDSGLKWPITIYPQTSCDHVGGVDGARRRMLAGDADALKASVRASAKVDLCILGSLQRPP